MLSGCLIGYRLKNMALVIVIETRVRQLKTDFLSAFVDKVIDLFSFEQVSNGTLEI